MLCEFVDSLNYHGHICLKVFLSNSDFVNFPWEFGHGKDQNRLCKHKYCDHFVKFSSFIEFTLNQKILLQQNYPSDKFKFMIAVLGLCNDIKTILLPLSILDTY